MDERISSLTEGQQGELKFWSTYASHLCEADKQTFCAQLIGIDFTPFVHDLQGKSILEVGAGPVGLTLRCVNGRRKVIEPLQYPDWVWDRYEYFGVEYERVYAEDMNETGWDEVWVINVLQHVDDLNSVLQKIRQSAEVIRIFEWLDIPADDVHKFSLRKDYLDQALGISGHTSAIDERYMYKTTAYHGCFDLDQAREQPEVSTPTEHPTDGLHQKWGGNLPRAMIHYIKAMDKGRPLVGAEIGVLAGQSATIILSTLDIGKLYLIDPYTVYATEVYTQAQLDEARRVAGTSLAPHKDKIVWVPFKSLDAARYLSDVSVQLDFVYLDGDHAYQPVLDDIAAFMSLVKDDGIIGGHDFVEDIVDPEQHRYTQVKSAVLDYTRQHGFPFYSCDFEYSDWWVDKTQIGV